MALVVLRCVFMFVCVGLTSLLIRSESLQTGPSWLPWLIFFSVIFIAAGVILLDMVMPHKRIDTISAVYFGTVVGMLLTYALSIAIAPTAGPDRLV